MSSRGDEVVVMLEVQASLKVLKQKDLKIFNKLALGVP